jgi:hypothetical protein
MVGKRKIKKRFSFNKSIIDRGTKIMKNSLNIAINYIETVVQLLENKGDKLTKEEVMQLIECLYVSRDHVLNTLHKNGLTYDRPLVLDYRTIKPKEYNDLVMTYWMLEDHDVTKKPE